MGGIVNRQEWQDRMTALDIAIAEMKRQSMGTVASILWGIRNETIAAEPPQLYTPLEAIRAIRQEIKDCEEIAEFGLSFVDDVERIVLNVIGDEVDELYERAAADQPIETGVPDRYKQQYDGIVPPHNTDKFVPSDNEDEPPQEA